MTIDDLRDLIVLLFMTIVVLQMISTHLILKGLMALGEELERNNDTRTVK